MIKFTIFDSNAIVLYLAEKTGKLLPKIAQERGPMLSWLMFVASGRCPISWASTRRSSPT
jgi:GSH-dependent disulfide-bond oxidoreductase